MRTPRWRLTLMLMMAGAFALGAGGCGTGSDDPGTPLTPTGSATAGTLPVTFTRTGGLAGVNQSIMVTADGAWTFTNNRTGATQQGTLTDAQRQQLLAQVADPGFVAQLLYTPIATTCADTFQYTVNFGGQSYMINECDYPNRPAVTAVMATLTDATPF